MTFAEWSDRKYGKDQAGSKTAVTEKTDPALTFSEWSNKKYGKASTITGTNPLSLGQGPVSLERAKEIVTRSSGTPSLSVSPLLTRKSGNAYIESPLERIDRELYSGEAAKNGTVGAGMVLAMQNDLENRAKAIQSADKKLNSMLRSFDEYVNNTDSEEFNARHRDYNTALTNRNRLYAAYAPREEQYNAIVDSYNQEIARKREEWEKSTLAALDEALGSRKASEKYFGYLLLQDNPDFEEKSRYKSTYRGGEKFNAWTGSYTDTGFNDILYDYINGDETARARMGANDVATGAKMIGADRGYLAEMEEDEVALFNYIYATQGAEEAYAFTDLLTADLNERQRITDEEYWRQYAHEHPVAASVFSVLESPLKGLSYIGQAADYFADGSIDQNAGYNRFSYLNSAIRGEVSRAIEESGNWGKVGSFAYNTGMSMGDFLLNSGISGGVEPLALTIMGMGAAADTVIAKKDAGYDDTRAFILGTAAGLVEAATEKIGFDALFKTGVQGLGKAGFRQYIFRNMAAEGAEEGASDVLNWIVDGLYDLCSGEQDSEWTRRVRELQRQGKSEAEAAGIAFAEHMEELGLDVLGGALSGGVMSGVGSAGNAINLNRTGAQFNGMGADTVQAIISEGLESDPSTQSYRFARQLQQKLDAGQTISNVELAQLYRANVEAIDAETVDDAVREQTEGQESTAVNDNPAQHTPAEQRVIEAYKNGTDQILVQFIKKVRGLQNQNYKNGVRHTITTQTNNAARKATELTGVDTSGYVNIINGSSIQHIDKRHGVNGTADHSMANIDDFARIGFVLDNFADARVIPVSEIDQETARLARGWRNSDNTPAPLVQFSMPVNGTYYVVEAVPSSKANVLAVVSAYMTSKK